MLWYKVNELAKVIDGEIVGRDDLAISRLLTDSRNLVFPEQTLFVAIKGERQNGHNFMPEMYRRQVRCFLVSALPSSLDDFEGASFILVDNTLLALQKLAAWHRKQFSGKVIGVTGSNGKTVVKEWLFELLKQDRVVVRNPKSYNSQIGVPLSVWLIEPFHDIGIFEAGISQPGEMIRLEPIIRPEIGIFTNIGLAHQENFDDTRQKVREKLKLFLHTQTLVYCRDYVVLHEEAEAFGKKHKINLVSWSHSASAGITVTDIDRSLNCLKFKIKRDDRVFSYQIPFTDDASLENTVNCILTMQELGYDEPVVADRLRQLPPVGMRLEVLEGIHDCTLINDAYNNDLNSFRIALNFLEQQQQGQKKVVILSDILQSGYNEDILYQEVASLIEQNNIDQFIGIGKSISNHASKFRAGSSFYGTTAEFLKNIRSFRFSGAIILLKGARKYEFEQIVLRLQQKVHETVFEINYNALVHNLNYYRSLLKPGTKIMVMVKAFSYGSGLYEIASHLQFQRVDYLAVAFPDEGVELRRAGISLPIMVMNPEIDSMDTMLEYNLEPEIYNFRTLEAFLEAVLKTGRRDVPFHLKLDTGMKRLGFEEKDMYMLLLKLKNNPLVRVLSVFTHLAASEMQAEDDFTLRQLNRFQSMADIVENVLEYPVLRHALNSAGIERFPEFHYSMVRLGIGLYGISESVQDKLQNVSSLRTTISQIKKVFKGESIGYSRKGIALRDSVIATIPIGYADGLSRLLGNGNITFKVNGFEVPTVGNICMDMCMIDVTDAEAKEGDIVTIFDSAERIRRIAEATQTITYEVLTNISRRVKRIYILE